MVAQMKHKYECEINRLRRMLAEVIPTSPVVLSDSTGHRELATGHQATRPRESPI